MKKTFKLLIMLTLVCSFVLSVSAFAADPGMVGNSVIKIKKPETYTSTTTQKEYYISGVTSSGVTVSVSRYNPFTGYFHLLYVDGKAAVQTAGASGLIAQKIYLTDGNNKIRIRTDSPDGKVTFLEVNITLNVLSLSDIQQSPIDIRKAIA
ncbi:MAG: hypothetical protein IJC89_00935 [Clostridia bacterium]|nr:hypothetical protein [Clostridia bacterium]